MLIGLAIIVTLLTVALAVYCLSQAAYRQKSNLQVLECDRQNTGRRYTQQGWK